MSSAPRHNLDVAQLSADPYPIYARLRRDASIAFVPELGSTLLTRRDDIYVCEKNIAVFSSHQPQGLMNRLMGQNMMRKDGEAHRAERAAIFPSVSPKTVRITWTDRFRAHGARILDALAPRGRCDLVKDFALPFSGECLKDVTGLTNITFAEMDAWSQAMIDGIANYSGKPEIEARCNAATAAIDAAIDDMLPVVRRAPNASLLSVMLRSGMPMDGVRANIKLAISGGQNEPRDAISGCAWALLTHPDQRRLAEAGAVPWLRVFEEYGRWMSPIGMSPRRVATRHEYGGVTFETEDRVFLMFGAANRDEACFDRPDAFDIRRDTSKAITFGAGPHYCAGAFASRAMVAEVALPMLFERLRGLEIAPGAAPRMAGWAFRGLLDLPVAWRT